MQENKSVDNTTAQAASTTVTIPRDKYEELIKEFQKIQSHNSLLKKAVLDEQKKNKALNLELDRKTTQLEQKIEENDALGFNNLRLEKRCAQLMFDLEELKKNANKDSFFRFLGSTTANNSEEIVQLKNEIEVLREDLQRKIQENESVHVELFELKSTHEATLNKLKDNINDLQDNIHQKDKIIEELTHRFEEISKKQESESEKVQERIQKLKEEIRVKKEAEKEMLFSIQKMQEEAINLKDFINRKVPFDDTSNNLLNILNIPPYSQKYFTKRIEIYERECSLFKQLTKGLAGLYASVVQKVQLLSKSLATSHSPTIKFIHNKLTTSHDLNSSLTKFSDELFKALEVLVLDEECYLKTLTSEKSAAEVLLEERKHKKQLYKSLKSWISFNRDSLLYLVICVQDTDSYALDAQGNESFVKFQDVYMKNTAMTKSYQKLYDTLNNCIKFIDDILIPKYRINKENKRIGQLAASPFGQMSNGKRNSMKNRSENIAAASDKSTMKSIKQQQKSPRMRNSSLSILLQQIAHLQLIQREISQFVDAISTTIQNEQRVIFVSPMIKSANEKIVQSLSVILTIISNIINSHKSLQQLQESFAGLYSRGAICDYWFQVNEARKSSEKSYYSDNNCALSLMRFRTHKYMDLLSKKQAEDSKHLENISLSEVIKNKREIEQLKINMKELLERNSTYQQQIEEYEREINSIREEIQLFEHKFVECFVDWNIKVQSKNLPELMLFEDLKIDIQKIDLQKYVIKINQLLQKSLDLFDSKLRSLLAEKKFLEAENVKILTARKSIASSQVMEQVDKASESTAASEDAIRCNSDDNEQQVLQTTKEASNRDSIILSKSENCLVKASLPNPEQSLLFSPAEINREKKLRQMFEQQVEYLSKQIEICDLKAMEYRLQWQHAVIELEEASEREAQISMRLKETEHLLKHTQDELKTHNANYERQIRILSENLAILQHRVALGDEDARNQSLNTSLLSSLPSFFTRSHQ
jgi:hypothetical protein